MPRAYLVRHGEAAAGWGDDLDPGLSDRGREQAAAAAATMAGLGPLPVVASPLRRCRETAEPFERIWSTQARVEPGVGEIESPTDGLEDRATWLRAVMRGTWDDLPTHADWRDAVVGALRALEADALVVTHFIAINVVVGEATGRRDVVCFVPDYCSRTVVDVDSRGAIELVELGGERQTVVR